MEDLKLTRHKLGVSQKTLAEMLGVNRVSLNMVERGKRKLPVTASLKLTKLCEVVNTTDKANEIFQPTDATAENVALTERITAQLLKYQTQLALLQKQQQKIRVEQMAANSALKIINSEFEVFKGLTHYAEVLTNEKQVVQNRLDKGKLSAVKEIEWRIEELNALISVAQKELQRNTVV